MENKTIENIAICSAVIGAFILIAYIIYKFDKIVLKWKDISATFGMDSTTQSATETANKSPKEVKKEAKTGSKDSEDSEDLKLIPIGEKTNKNSDPEPGTSTKDVKPKLDVESPSPSNITNFANIIEDHKGMQTNNETIYADDFRVTKDARINNVGNIETTSQVYSAVAVIIGAIGVGVILGNSFNKMSFRVMLNSISAKFEKKSNQLEDAGNYEEVSKEELINRDSIFKDKVKINKGTSVKNVLNIKRICDKKVVGGKTVVARDLDLTVETNVSETDDSETDDSETNVSETNDSETDDSETDDSKTEDSETEDSETNESRD
ncbi:unnamed protein product [Diamesa tonsa]